MTDDHKDDDRPRGRTVGPGTTSDPNQSNIAPKLGRGEKAEDTSRGKRDPAKDRDDAAQPRHRTKP